MKVTTEKFGEIEYDESALIAFSDGMLGFPDTSKYILMNTEEGEASPFKWLQSVDDSGPAFLVIDPYLFKPDYNIKLDDSTKNELDIKLKEDYIVMVVVVVYKDPRDSTANLLGPIVINASNKRGKQLVLSNPSYTTKHRILQDTKK